MAIVLKPHELRVLGVLIEKSMAQPGYYPMTLNAITAAANQKSNRDPMLELTEGEIATALHGLQQWQLAGQAPPDRNSRANRFQHDVEKRFGWEAPERALMAELMLRGPQTVGELRTHASRLTHLNATDYVREVLAGLERHDPPFVVELARQPGRSANRFAHLLGGDVVDAQPAGSVVADASDFAESLSSGTLAELSHRVSSLELEMAELRRALAELQGRTGQTPTA